MRTMSVEFKRFLDLIKNDEKSLKSLNEGMDSKNNEIKILVSNKIAKELLSNSNTF